MTLHHVLDSNAGAPGVTMRLAEAFRALGHEATVVSYDSLPAAPPRIRNVAFPWWLAGCLARSCAGRPIDVIDASTGDAAVFGMLRRAGIVGAVRPLLVTRSHGLEHLARDALMREVAAGYERLSWRYPLYWGGWRLREVATSICHADVVFVLNGDEKSYVCARLGVPEKRVRVVANGVEDAVLEAGSQIVAGEASPEVGIAHVGSFIGRKGIRYLVPALHDVLRSHRHVRVGLFGTGTSEQTVREAFAGDVQDRLAVVERFGRASLPEMLRPYQIGVSASLFEGFPGALLEMMACSMAPVATALAGSVEVLGDVQNGLVVPPGDASALADALNLLIRNPRLLRQVRSNAVERAQRFSWTRVAEQQIAQYRAGLSRRASGSSWPPLMRAPRDTGVGVSDGK